MHGQNVKRQNKKNNVEPKLKMSKLIEIIDLGQSVEFQNAEAVMSKTTLANEEM